MVSLPFLSRLRPLISDLAGCVADIPFFTRLRQLRHRNRMRLEDEITEGRYVVRAEIPGIDPASVDITADVEQLTINAERSQEPESSGRSEFCYGSFVRSVSLPDGASPDETTTKARGILTVSMPVDEADPVANRRIAVQTVD